MRMTLYAVSSMKKTDGSIWRYEKDWLSSDLALKRKRRSSASGNRRKTGTIKMGEVNQGHLHFWTLPTIAVKVVRGNFKPSGKHHEEVSNKDQRLQGMDENASP